MPVKTASSVAKARGAAKKTVDTTCRVIRKHWSTEEARRRRQMADAMQTHLVEALGLRSMAPR